MNFLLDAGVPVSVGKTLTDHHHNVIFYTDVLAEKATDLHVCETAMANDAILVAIDGDMRRIANRFGNNPRFEKLSLLHFGCNEVLAAKRLTQAIQLIESEWAFKEEKPSRRFWVEITGQYFKTLR
ncbi:DUF5615 family PIN-like protein [Brucella anthropi]|uniref:DUF5615 family PIN-like protein n=1 Tax=Brucella anthropi TaxID=529 RepID=UPI000CFBB9BD|nr:DUF5615 family PIN-like protein [Ochrobactrum sp. MYb49]PQZ62738.1 hypothetical protein CQ057_14930 [Ochrobactrum sp. MYb49]